VRAERPAQDAEAGEPIPNRLVLFKRALEGCKRVQAEYPSSRAVSSIIEQLEYPIAAESDKSADRSRLIYINIGVPAARNMEDLDGELADLLHVVSGEIHRML
jgi:hypothetical protein